MSHTSPLLRNCRTSQWCITIFPSTSCPHYCAGSHSFHGLLNKRLLGDLFVAMEVMGSLTFSRMALPTETSGVNNKMWMAPPLRQVNNKMWMALPTETSGVNNKMWMAPPTETSGGNNKMWVRTHTSNCTDTRCLITVFKNKFELRLQIVQTRDAWSLFSKTAQAHDLFPLHWYLDSPQACSKRWVYTQVLTG